MDITVIGRSISLKCTGFSLWIFRLLVYLTKFDTNLDCGWCIWIIWLVLNIQCEPFSGFWSLCSSSLFPQRDQHWSKKHWRQSSRPIRERMFNIARKFLFFRAERGTIADISAPHGTLGNTGTAVDSVWKGTATQLIPIVILVNSVKLPVFSNGKGKLFSSRDLNVGSPVYYCQNHL